MGSKRVAPRPPGWAGGHLADAPLAHRRPGYPWAGCSPAEPAFVSPGAGGCTASPARTQEQAARHRKQRKGHGHDGRTGCSEGSPVLGLDNGVHFTGQMDDVYLFTTDLEASVSWVITQFAW